MADNTPPRTRAEVLQTELLPLRAKALEIAAGLDRLDRADGQSVDDQLQQLRQALAVLLEDAPNRAERVQLIFSRQYDPAWRQQLEVVAGR
ncbi:MAG: hypothetical protein AAGA92_07430 [Planctomycetota bacterium]